MSNILEGIRIGQPAEQQVTLASLAGEAMAYFDIEAATKRVIARVDMRFKGRSLVAPDELWPVLREEIMREQEDDLAAIKSAIAACSGGKLEDCPSCQALAAARGEA